ncbi:MAG TPA: hypothetical protein VF240_17700 [Pyrinomonadaceae bacterium]
MQAIIPRGRRKHPRAKALGWMALMPFRSRRGRRPTRRKSSDLRR